MDKLILTPEHLAELAAILGELPHKHAIPVAAFVQRRIREQAAKPQPARNSDGSTSSDGSGDVGGSHTLTEDDLMPVAFPGDRPKMP